jgi:3-phenylpropionate/trans-cinnamate dioxygenase ferredoxin reductase component
MKHYKYLIVGGGMTADAVVSGIKKIDPQGAIGLISAENHPPYKRPPLSKDLWKGKPVEKIWLKTPKDGVELHLGYEVTSLNPQKKSLRDNEGNEYIYDKLLLATGGTPRKLPFGGKRINYYRTFEDYKQLSQTTGTGHRYVVIGGGFIGSEISAALAMNDESVTIVFPESGVGANIFPADLSDFLNKYYEEQGVEVISGEMVKKIEERGKILALQTDNGREILAEHIVAGIGITPNTSLAEAAGIDHENGILVDEFLHTSQADIFAAGDVANFYNPALDKRMRVEHEDNAYTMGQVAGRNMARQALGQEEERYDHLPFFYSDLFDFGYEAVGELNSSLDTFADWQDQFQKGVIYYLKDSRVRGVLLWNVWGQVGAARKLIAESGPFKPEDLHGRLPEGA